MSQDPIEGLPRFVGHDVLVLDAGDDSGRATTATATFNVDIEYALESLGPIHRDVPFSG
ncbi:MAG: hypothetical protein R3E50_02750 [Halioglobus sp.]